MGREIHREVAELAAPLLGWSADDVRREVADHDTYVAERLLGGVARTKDVTELVSGVDRPDCRPATVPA